MKHLDGGRRVVPEHLLAVAAADFAELGYEGVSMRSLADRCGVTTMALYYHFGSKEALYAEVCRQKFDDITHVMRERLAMVTSAESRFSVFVGTLFDEWHRDNTLLLLTQRDVVNALASPQHSIAAAHYAQLMRMMNAILGEGGGTRLGEEVTFSLGALLYGYCALMSFDRRHHHLSAEDYLVRRRARLIEHAQAFWRSMTGRGS